MSVKKAVITAAGLGTRLLPATKETPKEMLPLFVPVKKGQICLKPLLQIVFEQLYSFGIREFCFIVGRGKRSIEDHFTPDLSFVNELKDKNKHDLVIGLEDFYSILSDSDITWKNQLSPKGFGDAVSLAKNFAGQDPFLVYAGDTFIISKGSDCLKRLIEIHNNHKAAASLLCERVQNPKRYGVIVGTEISRGNYKIKKIIEKPRIPPSDLVSLAVYLFNPTIFKALEKTPIKHSGEKELTDAIQMLIDQGNSAYATELKPEEKRLDIGTADAYMSAVNKSYEWAKHSSTHGKTGK